MIVDSPAAFRAAFAAGVFPDRAESTARAALLVRPVGFRLADESRSDNRYMARDAAVSESRAQAQHEALAAALSGTVAVRVFDGLAETPDAVFPNNVFATVEGRSVIGRMRHEVRRREARREDIRRYLGAELGHEVVDLSGREDLVAELTGPLVVDRARAIGYCGLTERCDRAGALAMHEAFDLELTFVFELAAGEYHTNVFMAVLAGRALVLHAGSFRDPAVPAAIAEVYGDRVLWLSDEEKAAFVGNCIAMAPGEVWMSAGAAAALRPSSRAALGGWGFEVRSVELDEIEKAGGSLRCCVAEIF
jgi:hypothetical protein